MDPAVAFRSKRAAVDAADGSRILVMRPGGAPEVGASPLAGRPVRSTGICAGG